jgi:peptide-methionine (R)-S-oxide reductase
MMQLARLAAVLALVAACAQPAAPPSQQPIVHAPESAAPAKAASAQTPSAPAVAAAPQGDAKMSAPSPQPSGKVVKSEEEWKKTLTPEQYHVLREKGTERPFTGKYWDTKTVGTYKCAGCGEPLFESDAKFDSGCGWPSFFKPLAGSKLVETKDESWGMVRTEITCGKCGAHMGHVFNDGPPPTGLRYCINSVSIELVPKAGEEKPPAK